MHVTIDTWVAVIGGIVAAIVGALLSWLLTRPASARNDAYDKVTGSIEAPAPNARVSKTLSCNGVVTGLQTGLDLWLAVEKEDRIWPKESRPNPGPDNKWAVTLFEDGAADPFSIALYVTDYSASKHIKTWLNNGAATGSYPELKCMPGARRLARVDGLLVQ
jgi:hypothetical protein